MEIHDKIKFKSIEEQVAILKGRGLVIDNEEKAKLYLLTNNYYNIINGYSKFFQISPSSDQYIENTNFDEVSRLYFFDKEIKQALFNSFLHAEHHLKSIFAHRFAEAYPNKKYAYLDIECYDRNNRINGLKAISKLSRLIETKIKFKDNVITHYVKKYDDIPVWVLVDFLDFGTLGLLIKSMPMRIQNSIAHDLTSFLKDNLGLKEQDKVPPFSPATMNSFIKNVAETRNVCAHNNRLLNFTCHSDSVFYPILHDQYGIKADSHRRTPYSTVISLQCFLSHMEYAILCNTLKKRFKNLSNQLQSIDLSKITQTIGFPINWERGPKKEQ